MTVIALQQPFELIQSYSGFENRVCFTAQQANRPNNNNYSLRKSCFQAMYYALSLLVQVNKNMVDPNHIPPLTYVYS